MSIDVLVASMRGYNQGAAFAAWYEFEDFVVRWTGGSLVELPVDSRSLRFRWSRRLQQAAALAQVPPRVRMRGPAFGPIVPLAGELDLVVVGLAGAFDLHQVRYLERVRDRAKWLVAVVVEAWPRDLAGRATSLEPFELFDRVYVGFPHGVWALQERFGERQVQLLSAAADVLANLDAEAPRTTTVFNPGRRSPGQHRALREVSTRHGWTYRYDENGLPMALNPAAHRSAYYEQLRSTQILIANYAKFDQVGLTGDVRGLTARLPEAIACGAVPAGLGPDSASLAAAGLDRIETLSFDLEGHDIAGIVNAAADVPRLDRMRNHNRLLAAEGHDWVHRWMMMANDLGFPSGEPAEARLRTLDDRAAQLASL